MNLTTCFTSKKDGDLGDQQKLPAYLQQNQIPHDVLLTMEQVHGTEIATIQNNQRSGRLKGVDGMIVTADSIDTSLVMVVKVADCIPAIFIDETNNIYGIAHVGWKGIVQGLGSKMIQYMLQQGSKKNDLQIILGPHICKNCYEISLERADMLSNLGFSAAVNRNDSKYYFSLQEAFKQHLSGSFNISTTEARCTRCNDESYFSYRASFLEHLPLDGHNVGILGLSRYNT